MKTLALQIGRQQQVARKASFLKYEYILSGLNGLRQEAISPFVIESATEQYAKTNGTN